MNKPNTEEAVLSCLLSGGWNRVGALTPDDFTVPAYRRIFKAAQKIAEEGKEPSVALIADRRVEVPPSVINAFCSVATVKHHIAELKDATLSRNVQQAIGQMHGLHGTGRERLIAAQSMLAQLATGMAGEPVRIGDALAGWYDELNNRTESRGWVKTGWAGVDERLGGFRPGDLIILAGRPGMGKTALALNIAHYAKVKTLFFSLEMSAHSLIDRIASTLSNVPLQRLRSPLNMDEQDWSHLTAASKHIKELPILIDESSGLSIEEIQARALAAKPQLVIVDYLSLIRTEQNFNNQVQAIAHITAQAKGMAKAIHAPVILLSQLSRKCEERQDKRPILADLRDSGAIEQDADAVGFVYRDEQYNPDSPHKGMAELIWRKVRQGVPGTVWFSFDGAKQKFTEIDAPTLSAVPETKYRRSGF